MESCLDLPTAVERIFELPSTPSNADNKMKVESKSVKLAPRHLKRDGIRLHPAKGATRKPSLSVPATFPKSPAL